MASGTKPVCSLSQTATGVLGQYRHRFTDRDFAKSFSFGGIYIMRNIMRNLYNEEINLTGCVLKMVNGIKGWCMVGMKEMGNVYYATVQFGSLDLLLVQVG